MTRPVDFFVVGFGIGAPEFISSRQNAGWIFIDYLANCVSMQTYLIQNADRENIKALKLNENGPNKGQLDGPIEIPQYEHPMFTRDYSLFCDIHDVLFSLTEEDVAAIKGKSVADIPKEKLNQVANTFRLLLVKPLLPLQKCGTAIINTLKQFGMTNASKQLIVVLEDTKAVPGSILIQDPNEFNRTEFNHGIASLIQALGSTSFIKFRIGVGKPSDPKINLAQHVQGQLSKDDQQDLNMFGYSLDVTAQALQHYACLSDIQKTKKKYSNIKKLPKNLRKMEGLGFPFKVEEINKPPAEEKQQAAK